MSEMRACAFVFEVANCDLNHQLGWLGTADLDAKAEGCRLPAENWLRLTFVASFHYNQGLPAGLPWH
jgi:hypothetical protein